jgi:hypothetical protein
MTNAICGTKVEFLDSMTNVGRLRSVALAGLKIEFARNVGLRPTLITDALSGRACR